MVVVWVECGYIQTRIKRVETKMLVCSFYAPSCILLGARLSTPGRHIPANPYILTDATFIYVDMANSRGRADGAIPP